MTKRNRSARLRFAMNAVLINASFLLWVFAFSLAWNGLRDEPRDYPSWEVMQLFWLPIIVFYWSFSSAGDGWTAGWEACQRKVAEDDAQFHATMNAALAEVRRGKLEAADRSRFARAAVEARLGLPVGDALAMAKKQKP